LRLASFTEGFCSCSSYVSCCYSLGSTSIGRSEFYRRLLICMLLVSCVSMSGSSIRSTSPSPPATAPSLDRLFPLLSVFIATGRSLSPFYHGIRCCSSSMVLSSPRFLLDHQSDIVDSLLVTSAKPPPTRAFVLHSLGSPSRPAPCRLLLPRILDSRA
jgi:hypothetical protein